MIGSPMRSAKDLKGRRAAAFARVEFAVELYCAQVKRNCWVVASW